MPVIRELFDKCGWYLNDPQVGTEEKTDVLRALLMGKVHSLTLQFILLLLSRNHLKHMPAAIGRFEQICDDYYGKATVRLRVPYELTPGLLERLKLQLVERGLMHGHSAEKVTFQVELDESLIGGFIAECDGVQIDTSLKSALTKLHI